MIAAWAWGLWLAVSWTWCIALFLPVILYADTGPGSWAIMLVCNVAGAAVLPFVFRTSEASLHFVRRHHAACRVFSWVTLVCQCWVIGWVASRLPWQATVAALAFIGLLVAAGRRRSLWLAAAALCWAVTLAAGLIDLSAAPDGRFAGLLSSEFAWHPLALYALPLVFAGFAASPWFDLTFHQALRASKRPRVAFAVAFPLLFGTMLVVSLVWRDDLGPVMLRAGIPAAPFLVPALIAIVLQLSFTAVLHARHLARPWPTGLAALAAIVLAGAAGDLPMPTGTSLNELFYRASIGFYGVLVPCWLWAGANATRPLGLALTGLALLLAAPPMLLDAAYRPLYPVALAVIALTRFLPRLRPAD